MSPEQLENFEQAFRSGTGGCSCTCPCGKQYFDDWNEYDFEWESEKELLRSSGATPVDYGIGGVVINGVQYANSCECWHEKARSIVRFLEENGRAVAEFLTLEKKRKEREAEDSPVVGGES